MFDSIKENLKKSAEDRARARAQRDAEAASQQQERAERERRIAAVRVITGDVKYRYAILDTLRVYAHYAAEPGEPYDPTACSQQATKLMQELAYATGADAVIHAQYHILRYTSTRRGYADVPSYETHLFGTAIKIMGPPLDWEGLDEES